MNKALIGLAAIIIVGGGAYFLLQPHGTTVSDINSAPTTQAGNMQSLGALVSAGKPVTCAFSTTTAAGSTQGTVYIANGMVAGDFTTKTSQGMTVDSHMLVRDTTNYVWSALSSTGFKSTVTAGAAPSSDSKGVDYNAQMDYQCSAWTVDSGKFTLPSNVSFMTTSSYTQPPQGAGATGAAPSGTPKGTAAQCAQCDSLPSAQKGQCIAALQC